MIPFIEVLRVADPCEAGAFGVLKHMGQPFAVTLEATYAVGDGWGAKIPPGRYLAKRRWFIHGGYWTYEITGVPGHEDLLLHVGNLRRDTDGCVLVGESFDPVNGSAGITHSGDGFAEFMRRAANAQEFWIEVKQV